MPTEPLHVFPPFVFYQTSHFAALAVLVMVGTLMVRVAKKGRVSVRQRMERTLAVLLVLQWPLQTLYYAYQGVLNVDRSFPLHLCDIVGYLSAFVLWTGRWQLAPYVYFLGLAGTFQGLITPALTEDFPSPRYWIFFISHGGVVLTALYAVFGRGWRPAAVDKWKAWGALNAFALIVGSFNALLGANYGFLCRKPPTASLFDTLGPWPWYVGVASLLGLTMFFILDAPFWMKRRKS